MLGAYARADTAIAFGHLGERLALELVDHFPTVAAATVFRDTFLVRGFCRRWRLVGWLERSTVVGADLELVYFDILESANLRGFLVIERVANVLVYSRLFQ